LKNNNKGENLLILFLRRAKMHVKLNRRTDKRLNNDTFIELREKYLNINLSFLCPPAEVPFITKRSNH